ncbi:MAG TPA: histidine phosphatase family protein [Beijerinckiaceae bacterium]|nr:histidine phosphatase family protein [Beijerinckiaceae bacterium]
MTTICFLVRHAAHELVDRVLCGRMPGVRLGAEGWEQARRAAARLARERVAAIHASPLERARETAECIGECLRLRPEICEAINEIDVGEWSGRTFDALREDLRWSSWNEARSMARPPDGETMLEVQARVVRHLEEVRSRYPEQNVVLVSHSDVIKAALLYCLGMPLDGYRLLDISPASISAVAIGEWGAKLLSMNEVPA